MTEILAQVFGRGRGFTRPRCSCKGRKNAQSSKSLLLVAEQDPKVQAALDAVMDELASAEELEEAALPTPEESERLDP